MPYLQGRCHVFKSGPVEETIECQRHERGESTRGGLHLSFRGLGGLSREHFEFLALLCAFLMGLYVFGTSFQSRFLLKKIFLGA